MDTTNTDTTRHADGAKPGLARADGSDLDWIAALKHLESVERGLRMLIGLPGVNAHFYQGVVDRLRYRFNTRERTKELHEQIMALSE